MKIAGTAVSWKTGKQECNVLSSLEVEYIAAILASKEIIWLHRLLGEFGYPQQGLTIIKIDNKGAKELANNKVVNLKTKHIDLRYHFIRECIKHDTIKLKTISGKLNPADVFTKALPNHKFRKYREEMGVLSVN